MLREHESGLKTSELCRKYGISDATFYKYKAKFGGMTVSDAQRLRTLESENGKLKRLLAGSMLDIAALKDIASKTSDARRQTQSGAPHDEGARIERGLSDQKSHAISARTACKLANLDRSTFQYEKAAGDDDALREELKVLAGKRRRFGYRRLGILLER